MSDGLRDLREKRRQGLPVADAVRRRRGCLNVACFLVYGQMYLAPGAPPGGTMLARFLLALAEHLEARAVHDQMQRLGLAQLGGRRRQLDGKPGLPAAEGAIARHSDVRTQQRNERVQQAFGRPQRAAVDFAQPQGAGNGLVTVEARLATLACALLAAPTLEHFSAEPQGKASPLDQGCVTIMPVADAVRALLFGARGALLRLWRAGGARRILVVHTLRTWLPPRLQIPVLIYATKPNDCPSSETNCSEFRGGCVDSMAAEFVSWSIDCTGRRRTSLASALA